MPLKKSVTLTSTLLIFNLLFLIVPSLVLALPIDFDWTDRPIAFRLSANELSGNEVLQPINISHNVMVNRFNDRITITTEFKKRMTRYSYALHVQGEEVGISINGKMIENPPVITSQGKYYLIPSVYFISYTNVIELRSALGRIPNLTYIEMFALLFTDEEAHFNRVFGEIPITIETQPAADPNQAKFDVLHYDLNHIITMTSSVITAQLTMIAQCIDSTLSLRTAVFDLDDNAGNFSVKSVDRGPGTASGSFIQDSSQHRVFIPLPDAPLPMNSIFTVRLFYSGIPNTGGAFGNPYVQGTHNSVPIVYTFSQPYGARKWWPCKDLPDDKATADLHWTCPTTYFAVSNGRLVSIDTNSNGTYTFHYTESYPFVSYLISVACTNYQYYYGIYTSQNHLSIMTVGNYIYPENVGSEGNGVSGTIAIMDFLARTFGEYPFLAEKFVDATFNGAGMEHQTCTSLPAGALSSGGMGRLNCHEMAHQWFGDYITCQNFNHVWLHEGFATYAEALWQEEQYDITQYHNYVNAWTTSDSYPLVSNSADNFSGSIVYRKGGWVLHMLRHITGDSTFFAALRNYAADTALQYGNALSIDFQHDVEKTMGGSTSLSWFFDAWLYQANRPNYTWSCVTIPGASPTHLIIYLTQTQAAATYIMPIDFKLTFSPSGSTTITVWNTQYDTQTFDIPLGVTTTIVSVTIDPDNWILDYNNASSLTPSYIGLPVGTSRFEAILPTEMNSLPLNLLQ
ncbi:MAG: M1 family metallopeptidase [bacterium]